MPRPKTATDFERARQEVHRIEKDLGIEPVHFTPPQKHPRRRLTCEQLFVLFFLFLILLFVWLFTARVLFDTLL